MLVLYPFSAKVTFPPFSLLLREQRWVTHSQPEWGLRRSAPFAVFNEEIEQQQSVSWFLPSFALQKICSWFQHESVGN